MSLALAKSEELIVLTTKIAVLIEKDIATLNDKRPAALVQDDNDRATLMLLYGKASAEFKNGVALASLAAPTKLKLKTATERLHKALKEQNRLLARFRHVTEGLVKAIAQGVAARETPSVYAKSGAITAAPRASAFTLNQAV